MSPTPEVTPERTWTFFGHWDNDVIHVEYFVPGEVADERVDTGYWEQGLWAAPGTGLTLEAAQAAVLAEYMPAYDPVCTVCGTRVELADAGDPESYVHAEDGDWGDHTAEHLEEA